MEYLFLKSRRVSWSSCRSSCCPSCMTQSIMLKLGGKGGESDGFKIHTVFNRQRVLNTKNSYKLQFYLYSKPEETKLLQMKNLKSMYSNLTAHILFLPNIGPDHSVLCVYQIVKVSIWIQGILFIYMALEIFYGTISGDSLLVLKTS